LPPPGGRKVRAYSPVMIGALSALGASFAFSANDMAIKFLSGEYALHQIILIRSVIALAVIICIVMPLSGGLGQMRTARIGAHLLRGLFVFLSNMAFFFALAAMPIAEATAVFFVSPVIIAVFSVVFLRETVGPWRWGAIVLGLAGVIIIIRPGSAAFQVVALFPLLAAAAYAALHMVTRRLGVTESAATMALYIQLTMLGASAVIGLFLGHGRLYSGADPSIGFLLRAWIWPAPGDWAILAITGLGSGLGGYLIAQAYRVCEAALIAPLEYVVLPMAVFWGFVVFGEWPDTVAWIGMLLIATGGIVMVWRETRNRKPA
jgi:drug/metabolite transporter (DMT)-like permease